MRVLAHRGVYRQENNMHAMRKLNVAVLLCALASGVAFADTVKLTANLEPLAKYHRRRLPAAASSTPNSTRRARF